ncbi:MAG: hypothetical protein NTW49_13545 [Bacteroidia bacterium]|nr:hypothetical protein [Bacteroidia bacterium]
MKELKCDKSRFSKCLIIFILSFVSFPLFSQSDSQTVPLCKGWNLYSTNINPVDPSVSAVFATVSSELIEVKDENGNIYSLSPLVNNLGNLVAGKAYFVKMTNNQNLIITGTAIPEYSSIDLSAGWNLKACLKNIPVPVENDLSPVLQDLLMVKDGGGHVFYPAYQLNQIGNMQPGLGYQLNMMSSRTLTYVPIISTTPVIPVDQTTVTSGGNVISDYGYAVTARGVCWNTTGNPTLSDSHSIDGTGAGSFTSSITGLIADTQYHVRAYATNIAGTAYGSEEIFPSFNASFTCGSSTISDYDGNIYNTIKIGIQCWMKQNLATTHYANGTSMVDGTNAGDITDDWSTKYWFVYNNDLSNKTTYGLLYTWAAAMNGFFSSETIPSGVPGPCPYGWHIPSYSEWFWLVDTLGNDSYTGGKLKETGTNYWNEPNTGATNESGFTALPGGYRNSTGNFANKGNDGYWWSTTEDSEYPSMKANYLSVVYSDAKAYQPVEMKYMGYYVRCLRY